MILLTTTLLSLTLASFVLPCIPFPFRYWMSCARPVRPFEVEGTRKNTLVVVRPQLERLEYIPEFMKHLRASAKHLIKQYPEMDVHLVVINDQEYTEVEEEWFEFSNDILHEYELEDYILKHDIQWVFRIEDNLRLNEFTLVNMLNELYRSHIVCVYDTRTIPRYLEHSILPSFRYIPEYPVFGTSINYRCIVCRSPDFMWVDDHYPSDTERVKLNACYRGLKTCILPELVHTIHP